MARITKSTEYIRHNFTPDERLTMGSELAEAHNRLADIDAEESVIKAQIKERRAGIEQKVGTLSREIATGFTMRNVECRIEYDYPNIGEATYFRDDIKQIVKTRPMTVSERQQEIEFVPPPPNQTMDELAVIVDNFFEENKIEAPPEPARQEPLITMGDAKKSRKKKEEPYIPPPSEESGTIITDDDMPF